jgi:hypothetical protein
MSKHHLQKQHFLHQENVLRELLKSVIDSLSSIVASRSWGRHVAVGTPEFFLGDKEDVRGEG